MARAKYGESHVQVGLFGLAEDVPQKRKKLLHLCSNAFFHDGRHQAGQRAAELRDFANELRA
jgi:hypothetical protein